MPRREAHSEDHILDSARRIVCERGPRAATVNAIAHASRAPTGSIYHRFRSLDELLARLWLRAVRRYQQAMLEAVADQDPIEGVVAAALACYDFCLAEREDAQLLAAFKAEELLAGALPPDGELRTKLETVNDSILPELRRSAEGVFGNARRPAVDLVLGAVVDVPYALARHHVQGGTKPPPQRRKGLEAAVRAMLKQRV